MPTDVSETSRFNRYVAAEAACLLLSLIPYVFIFALPVYTILATQLYFFKRPLWVKVAASLGPVFLWITALLSFKQYIHL